MVTVNNHVYSIVSVTPLRIQQDIKSTRRQLKLNQCFNKASSLSISVNQSVHASTWSLIAHTCSNYRIRAERRGVVSMINWCRHNGSCAGRWCFAHFPPDFFALISHLSFHYMSILCCVTLLSCFLLFRLYSHCLSYYLQLYRTFFQQLFDGLPHIFVCSVCCHKERPFLFLRDPFHVIN